MRRAARKDATHNPIARAFEKLGYCVVDTSRLGNNFPDMVIAKAGQTALVEAKRRGGKLTEGQERFRALWRGLIFECRTLDDVLAIDGQIMGVFKGPRRAIL